MKSNRHFIKDSVQTPMFVGASLALCFLMLLFTPLVIQGSSNNNDSGDANHQITYLSANDILSDIHYFCIYLLKEILPKNRKMKAKMNPIKL